MADSMDPTGFRFADILAPMTPETFFAEHYGKKWVHIPGGAEKFRGVLNWDILTELLNMSGVWTSASLGLVLDRKGVPILDYCYPSKTSDGKDVYRPDGARVMGLLRKGASLVANDIDSFTPGLSSMANSLEETLSAKIQANLYCSWQQHQAFDSHLDTHDVYALQLEGEKLWHVYEGCVDSPIAHPAFSDMSQAQIDKLKGKLAAELVMRPGDLIYLPRGQYHDALAVTGHSMHVTFGATSVIGLDYLNALFDMAVDSPLFRAQCPRPAEGRQRLAAHLEALAAEAGRLSLDPRFVDAMARFQAGFRYPRGGYDLPIELEGQGYAMRPGFELVWDGDTAVLNGPRGSLPVPPGLGEAVEWIVRRERFTAEGFAGAADFMEPAAREKLLGDLVNMKVLDQT